MVKLERRVRKVIDAHKRDQEEVNSRGLEVRPDRLSSLINFGTAPGFQRVHRGFLDHPRRASSRGSGFGLRSWFRAVVSGLGFSLGLSMPRVFAWWDANIILRFKAAGLKLSKSR